MESTQDLLILRAGEIVARARERSATVATAESCTAGMIASSIADIPGASSVLRGGMVTYCDEIKRDVLGVPAHTLHEFSAVSEQCACEMAARARDIFCSSVAVSATGYAGPGGGTHSDPAGTVYLGISDDRGTRCVRVELEGSRNEVRLRAAAVALELVLQSLDYREISR